MYCGLPIRPYAESSHKTESLEFEDSVAYRFEVAAGLDELDQLERNPNLTILKMITELREKYFPTDDDMPMTYDGY